MPRWQKKPKPPVDRAMRELENQLAQVKRQLEAATAARPPAPDPGRPLSQIDHRTPMRSDGKSPATATTSVGAFMKQMLRPASQDQAPTYRTREDLFDVAGTPAQQIEMDQFAFDEGQTRSSDQAAETDLFRAAETRETADGAAQADRTGSSRESDQGSKLVHYLSAGSIRSYKPLRRVQREDRNRFFAWVGLAVAAVWILYVVVR